MNALDTYYDRMTSALGDKKRVLEFVEGTRVLDVGCGSGDLLHVLLEMGYDAYGVDPATESLERVLDPGRVVRGYADEIAGKFGEGFFDTIICSSVLHEVFSYGNGNSRVGSIGSLEDTVANLHRALKPGGRLIIRDGVAPDSKSIGAIEVDNPREVYKFLASTPFLESERNVDRHIYIGVSTDPYIFVGTVSSLMEFAFTYTWGPESFEREVQEFYGIFTLDEYASFVEKFGFKCVRKCAYVQDGYREHLYGKVKFDEMEFPNTNAIWVFDR